MAEQGIKEIKIDNTQYLIEPTIYTAVSQTSASATFTAALTNFQLFDGALVAVKFNATNNANATLNINSTGAKPIYYNNAKITANQLKANHTYTLSYVKSLNSNNGGWELIGDLDTNTQSNYGNITTSGKIGTTADLAVYTTTDGLVTAGTLKTDAPSASGTATAFITSVSQDSKGKISASKANLPTASTDTAGITKVGADGGAAAYNHNHDINNLTNASSYLKWQTTTAESTALYDFGVYVNMNHANGSSMTGSNYFNILNIPYRKASGNAKADWGWQLGNITENDGRLWYRTIGNDEWGDWQTIAHATQSANDIGSATQPVYMTAAGVITAGTALGAAAYKEIINNTSAGALGWNNAGNTHADNLRLVDVNTLAYWDGAYRGTSSNLTYYKGGAFGTMAKETATDYAKLDGAAFTGAVTVQAPTDDTNPATKEYVDDQISASFAANNAMVYKGVRAGADTSSSNTYGALTPAANCGDTYKVSTAGFINGLRVEVGDMLICTTDNTAEATSSNYTTIRNNWNIIQTSEGSVSTSSISSTDNAIVRWDEESGRIIQNSGITIDDNNTIYRDGVSINWNQANSRALLRLTSVSGWSPILSLKAHSGWWSMGHYENGNYYNHLLFTFLNDNDVSGVSGAQNHMDYTVRLIPVVHTDSGTTDRVFVTAPWANSKAAVGNSTQPIYIDDNGVATACATTTVSNAWSVASNDTIKKIPMISTTVNGVTGTAVAIPEASTSAGGIVTIGTQNFGGSKTFTGDTFEVRADIIRLRNKANSNNAATNQPYVTSLVIGDGRYINFTEYKDDHLVINSKSILLDTTSNGITAYDPSKTYSLNAIVWYDRSYYYCSTAITEAEAWNSAHWTAMPASNIMANASFVPWKNNSYALGTSSYRWSKVYIGTENSYGNDTTPIYWSNGVPKACTPYADASVNHATSASSASSATTATYSTYPKIVASNEIRFDVNTKPSSAIDLHIGYAWSDGSKDAKINGYRFDNGNGSNLAKVYASEFVGALNGNANTATRINGNLDALTDTSQHNIWVSSTNAADGIPKYISGVYITASTGIITAKGFSGPLSGNATSATTVKQYYTVNSTDAPLQVRSNNKNVYVWQAGHATSESGGFSNNYALQYYGEGSSLNNYLILKASNSSTVTDAVQVDENGNITVAKTITGTITNSTWTTLLKPINTATTASASTWSIPSGSYQVWGERFSDTRLKYTPSGGSESTVTDTGDWTMWLTSGGTSNTATLNMRIDGTYYGSFSGNLSGNASSATSASYLAVTQLTNQNLNDYTSANPRWYYAVGGNTVTNKPTGVNAFGLYIYRNADGYRAQELYDSNGNKWMRHLAGSSWTAWEKVLTSANYDDYALPLSGGQMTGPLTWKDGTALPEKTSAEYFLAIDAFADGGKTYWVSKANVLSSIGAAAAVTGGYLPKSGGTMTGALNFANNTWNLVGDDVYLGDINKGGHIGIQGKNGNTGIFFTTYNQTSKLTGGAITWDGTKFSITSTTAVDASISGNAATASKVSATLNQTAKTYLLGTQTTITATATNVSLTGDTGVYLTTTAGELSAYRYSWHYSTTERAYTLWNDTDQSIDFIFI